jgi:hypothetical protein
MKMKTMKRIGMPAMLGVVFLAGCEPNMTENNPTTESPPPATQPRLSAVTNKLDTNQPESSAPNKPRTDNPTPTDQEKPAYPK